LRQRAQRVERPAGGDAETAALAGSEAPEAGVASQLSALLVDDRPGGGAEAVALEERAIVAACEEARLLALGAGRHGEPRTPGLRARLLLRLLAEREPETLEQARVEAGQHVRLVLTRIGRAGEQEAPVAVHDPAVVACREPMGARPPDELEQLGEAEAAVAADARVRRLAPCVAADERPDHRAPELLAQIERDVRNAERVAGRPRGKDRLGRAAGALGVRPLRVAPEPQRHAGRVPGLAQKRDRAVDAAAHRDRDATRLRRGAEDRPDRVRKRVERELVTADGGGLEQRQALERALEPLRVRARDSLAVD